MKKSTEPVAIIVMFYKQEKDAIAYAKKQIRYNGQGWLVIAVKGGFLTFNERQLSP